MRVVVAGSRNIFDYELLKRAIDESGFEITEIVSGGAKGIDSLGEHWAAHNSVACKVFNADWQQFGRRAGPLRNKEMAEYADALIAIWDGESKGTKNMILNAQNSGLQIHVHMTENK